MTGPGLVLHDYYEGMEGGGRLCAILAAGLSATLGYGFARPDHPLVGAHPPGQRLDLNAFSRLPLWRQIKLARAFQAWRPTAPFEYAVYSGFYAPLAVGAARRNLLYCHTPPRFVYDQREFYLRRLPLALRPLLQAFIRYLRPRYEQAARRMDRLLVNSANVQRRLRDCLGLEADIVHPPCELEKFTWRGQQPYYLSTARLDPLKRVDKIIRAFLAMPDKSLVVASGGPEAVRLRKLAGDAPNIRFTGWLSESALQTLVGEALAVIYLPRDEDFGMSPVEAMAAGKPVIGVAEGGLLETVIPDFTGLLLDPADDVEVEAIRRAVAELTPARALAMRRDCEARAELFSAGRFLACMKTYL